MKSLADKISAVFRSLAIKDRHLILMCLAGGGLTLGHLEAATGKTRRYAFKQVKAMRSLGLTRITHGRIGHQSIFELGPVVKVHEESLEIDVEGYVIVIARQVNEGGK